MPKKLFLFMDFKLRGLLGAQKQMDAFEKKLKDTGKSIKDSATKPFNNFAEALSKAKSPIGGVVASVKDLGAALAKAGPLAPALWVALGGAVVLKAAANVATLTDRIDKLSQRLGLTSDEFQILSRQFEMAGTSAEEMQGSMVALQRNVVLAAAGTGEAVSALKQLGIQATTADGKVKTTTDLFYETAEALAGMEDKTSRAALAQQIMGEGAAKIAPLLNQGADAIRKQREESEKFIVANESQVKAGADFKDAMADLGRVFKAVFVDLVTPAVRGIASLTKLLVNSGFVQWIMDLADVIGTVLLHPVQTTTYAFMAMAQVIQSALSEILKFVGNLIEFIPDKLVPDGWKESLWGAQKAMEDMAANSKKAADDLLAKLIEDRAINVSDQASSNEILKQMQKQFQKDIDSINKEARQAGMSERQKELDNLNQWMSEKKQLVALGFVEENTLNAVYAERRGAIEEKYTKKFAEEQAKRLAEAKKKAAEIAKAEMEKRNAAIAATVQFNQQVLAALDASAAQEIAGIKDKTEQAIALEAMRYQKAIEAAEKRNLAGLTTESIYHADLQAAKAEHEAKLTQIEKEAQAERDEQQKEQQEKQDERLQTGIGVAQQVASTIGAIFSAAHQVRMNQINAEEKKQIEQVKASGKSRAQQQKEIEKIEAQAEKKRKEQLEKKKRQDIAMAIINGAVAIVKGYADYGPILGTVFAVLTAAATAAQIAVIASQQFAKGGVVGGVGGTDSQLVAATPGEAVLTSAQQREFMDVVNGRRTSSGITTVNAGDIIIQGNVTPETMPMLEQAMEDRMAAQYELMKQMEYTGKLAQGVLA